MDEQDSAAVAAPSGPPEAPTAASPVDGGGTARRAPPTTFSLDLARHIARRVAAGECLSAICAEAGMPHRASLYRWVKTRPRFGKMLRLAKDQAGRRGRTGSPSGYCPVIGAEICERMAEGEVLAAICRDPMMPAFSTVHRWRRTFHEFAEAFAAAKEAQAHRLVDEGLEIAGAIPLATPYGAHVRLTHIRWTAGVWAPDSYRVKMVEPAEPPVTQTVMIRRFQLEMRKEDGAVRVVGFCPNPETGRVERDSEGAWEVPSPGKNMVWVEKGTGRQAWPKAEG